MDADWRRWESEPWRWQEQHRAALAAQIWQQHCKREVETRAWAHRADAERSRMSAEEAAEASRRYRQHGARPTADPYSRYQQQYGEARVGASGHQHLGADGVRRDFLGYYAVLGLEGVAGSSVSEEVSGEAVKAAFKARALQLHPDRLPAGSDAAALERATQQFHKLQLAYETLRDTDKRRAYDRGQLTI